MFEDEKEDKKPKLSIQLYYKLCEDLMLWQTPDKSHYCDFINGGRRLSMSIEGKEFENFLRQYALIKFNVPILSATVVKDLQASIISKCAIEGVTREISIRVAQQGQNIYYDLCGEDNQAIMINKEGWDIIENPPVKFYRPKGMLPQVTPKRGGSIDLMRKYTNFEKEEEFNLYVGWLLSIFNPVREYPILILNGGQGTAKSVTTLLSKMVLDPHEFKSFSEPKDIRDLVAYAKNTFVISMDNISSIQNWLSDSMCRLTHGTAALGGRELYKDHDMAAFCAARSIILNGIPEFIERNDLADRVVQIHLKPIPKEKRRTGSSIMEEFQKDLPYILGALMDLAVLALRKEHLNDSKMALPRMADWASFVGHALGFEEVISVYNLNKEEAESNIAENNPVASALVSLMLEKQQWCGDLQALQVELYKYKPIGDKYWPSNVLLLRNELKRLEPSLNNKGINIIQNGRHTHTRRTLYEIYLPGGWIKTSATTPVQNG